MHTKECLANALISAIQNLRDTKTKPGWNPAGQFRQEVEKGTPLEWAEQYLADGTQTCICN